MNVVHVLWSSSLLTPPLPLSAFSIKSQGSTWGEFAGPENICIAPKTEQGVEQQNFKTVGF